ncbi:hypothetical protein MPTK1_7g11680 [Marchantia polymorpha subsp. ruderalis]|uniref:DUF7932 domain-containing protein n=2 Tax=Marchantia polymorpha TaxID=3197 RepID=A0AAF6BYI2_MARPO|nr:hypothetical protein MARPO_0003s0181 [Marchantia polymorpha]BBN17066.1 hypothetical protein Mp_7g11680 [Marchantia polymorpha subsp. ruderalis]|eukprot:PTQ49302.1 hypothetical protein MARPO_0003s0181 [Marchantia polymorpha]
MIRSSEGADTSAVEEQKSSIINFDPSSSNGEGEFGVPALQGYTFNLDGSQNGIQELAKQQSQGMRAISSLPEFVINAAGIPGLDGSNGEHGMPGSRGADGQHGKDGYGPGRPGKPGRSGKDGKAGTAGKKGKKATNGTAGGRAMNVYLRLDGEGPQGLVVTGHLERVEKQTDAPESAAEENRILSTVLIRERLSLERRIDAHRIQGPSLSGTRKESDRELSPVIADDELGGRIQFLSKTGVILIDAHGGRGGNGGDGGNGGCGGDGGNGGNGGNGGDGRKGMKPGLSGENGGRGGDGGAGMAGGPGNDGGSAGKGGNAGSGGQVTIETTNPELLMLVEADTRAGTHGTAGRPGNGGEGGKAGSGGIAGRGGTGGPPWDKLYLPKYRKTKYYYGCGPGRDGASGRAGGLIGPKNATAGNPGSPAVNGKDAKDGQVTWILKSASGEIIEKGKSRYNCAVCQYRVRSTSGNGIISPGSIITIDKVTVCNNGGMTLPAGTRLSFAATGGVLTSGKGVNKVEILPELAKNKRYKCHSTFSISLEKLDGPAGGAPFQALVSIAPYLELGGRTFPVADQVMEIPVQYPIRIADDVQFPHTVHQGGTVFVKVNVQNISTRTYGGRSTTQSGGVTLLVLLFIELEGGERIDHTWRREVPESGAGRDQKVEVDFRIDTNAQPYSILSLQTHLLLNTQSIEFRHVESRVIPVYGGADIDAVLLTDTDFRPGAYKLWKGILAFLGLKYVFWDISWYRTYSMEDVPWLGKHRLVIFTHLQEDNFNSLTHWVRDVLPPHISALGGVRGIDNAAAIFVGPTYKEVAREMVDWNSGEKVKDVTTLSCISSCYSTSNEEALKRAVLKASSLQRKLRAIDKSPDYTLLVAPMKGDGIKSIPLMLYRETLPALFNTKTIPVKMNEDPAGVDLLACSPLLTTQDAPDIYSGISTAIGGLITNPSTVPTMQRAHTGHPIILDGKNISLGYMIAGMIMSLPIQFRLDLLFRFTGHPASDIPAFSSSGVAFSQVIGLAFYLDLRSDWVCQRHTLPHGQILVQEFKRAVNTRGFMTIFEIESFVVELTGGLILLKDEFKSLTPSKAKARHLIKGMLKQIETALGRTRSVHIPKAEKVRTQYKNLQRTLPPWMFSFLEEQQIIRVLDSRGKLSKKLE